jgi:hypothetical protein
MTEEASGSSLRYTLPDEAARARGRATAAFSAVATAMPPILALVLLAQAELAPVRVLVPIAVLVAGLGAARAFAGYRIVTRRLRALEVRVHGDALEVRTVRVALTVRPRDIVRIVEIHGALGGLRLELRDAEDLPARIDVPRGGTGYGDLRARLATFSPIEHPPPRRRMTRIALGAAVVLAIFFVPFFVDDVVMRSRVAACVVVLALWVAARAALGRA